MKNGRKTQASTKVKASTNSRDNDQDIQEDSEPGEVRVSTVLTNGPCCNFECDNYINNKKAIREAMCFMMDPNLGKYVYFVQFSQRFDGIDRNDRYVNRNTVLFNINLRGLDGIQGPVYVGTGCVFYRTTLYGYEPPHKPKTKKEASLSLCCGGLRNKGSKPIRKGSDKKKSKHVVSTMPIFNLDDIDERVEGLENLLKTRKYFANKSPTCSRDQ